MLDWLRIENIAVIEQTDIYFHEGFNALTGETGAGKSIVIDAMGAILGSRTSRDLIRTGADKAFVSAQFSDLPPDILSENGVEPDEDGLILIQREIFSGGKNICRINGRPVTVALLRKISGDLVNIHGQHDGQKLLDEACHGTYLDQYGHTRQEILNYQEKYKILRGLEKEIQNLQMDEAERARRIEHLNYQVQELERAELMPGEEEELSARLGLLRNAEKYLNALSQADYNLNGDDEISGVISQIQQAENAMSGISDLGEDLAELSRRLEQARLELDDIGEAIRDRRMEFEFSPAELDAAESRMDLLYRLEKKYGPDVNTMLNYLEQCRAELDRIETADDELSRLQQEREKIFDLVFISGRKLTEARKAAARELEKRILKELNDLDMKKVRFAVDFQEKEPDSDGCDIIKFLMSANAGDDLKPLAKIASGGELARIMLALKNVLSEADITGTMVFDEIDTGVSGRAAQRIAEKLAQVSRHKQVLCVTHLPQLAAMADEQFSVEKGERDGRTYTNVIALDRKAREMELARMSGGSEITRALLKSAGELLDSAEKYRRDLN